MKAIKPLLRNSFASLNILDRYIIRELLSPFVVALFFFIVLFISTALRESLGDLLAKGISFWIVLLFFLSVGIEQLPNILVPVALFASILAVRRLSSDNELIAMRSVGMGYRRIYLSFAIVGLLLCFFMGFITFYLAPRNKQYRRTVAESAYFYQSLAFVKPGLFFNRPVWGGNHTDIYAKNRDSSRLNEVYVHGWAIDFGKGSRTLYHRGENKRVGLSQTQKIIFAKQGELIERPRSFLRGEKEGLDAKGNTGIEQEIEDEKLPEGLAGRDLADLSFMNRLPEIEDKKTLKKYIRLANGFMLQMEPARQKLQMTNFLSGFLDYELSSPPKGQGYFGVTPSSLTLGELFTIYNKLEDGGLIIDPFSISGRREFSPKNYVEIPPKKFIPLLKEDPISLSRLSPKEIQDKYAFYVPIEKDTPEKRQAHFKKIYGFGARLLEKEEEFLFVIHDRISIVLGVFIFLLLSLPLGLGNKRSGKGPSFSIALLIYALYSSLGKFVEFLFENKDLSPFWAAWLPEMFLLAVFFLVFFRSEESRQLLASLKT